MIKSNINRDEYLNMLFQNYSSIEQINDQNNDIIKNSVYFQNVSANDYVSSINVSCVGIIFILDGVINIRRVTTNGEETNLYNISKGEICHEALSCIMNFKPLSIYAKAVVDSKVAILPKNIFNEYLLNNTDFLKYAYKDIFLKFNILIEKKEDRNNASVETRIIKYLLSKGSSIIYDTHSIIADEIDCSREAVSRKLKQLENKQYVRLSRGKIFVLDAESLRNNLL